MKFNPQRLLVWVIPFTILVIGVSIYLVEMPSHCMRRVSCHDLDFSPDDRFLAMSGYFEVPSRRSTQVLKIASDGSEVVFSGKEESTNVAWSQGGDYLVVAENTSEGLQVIDTRNWQPVEPGLSCPWTLKGSLCCDQGGAILFTAYTPSDWDGPNVWGVNAACKGVSPADQPAVTQFAVCADHVVFSVSIANAETRHVIAIGHGSGCPIHIGTYEFDAERNLTINTLFTVDAPTPSFVQITPDGQYLGILHPEGCRIYRLHNTSAELVWEHIGMGFRNETGDRKYYRMIQQRLSASGDSQRLAFALHDEVIVVRLSTLEVVSSISVEAKAVALNSNGRKLAIGDWQRWQVRIHDVPP